MATSTLRKYYRKYRHQMKIWEIVLSGPPYRSSLNRIIIDLTHFCDLSCINCNRSCGLNQAPENAMISTDQIRRFVCESIESGKRWERILLEGGEPSLHPDIDEILAILLNYKSEFAPACEILLCTNGYGEKAGMLISKPPKNIIIRNSEKSPGNNNGHFPFNIAPVDLWKFRKADYSRGCYIHKLYGIGLNRNGYYPHPICGGIDRIFGFDIGLKKIPDSSDELTPQMERLCGLCGHFYEYVRVNGKVRVSLKKQKIEITGGHQSKTWKNAYSSFRISGSNLTPY